MAFTKAQLAKNLDRLRAIAMALPALLGDPRCRPAPYLARGGWIRMELAAPVDWTEVRELAATSYRLIAPKTLAAQVD